MITSLDVRARSAAKTQVLGRLEESILLVTMICGPEVTADIIQSKLEESIGKRTLTSVVTTLDRLKAKGMIESNNEAESSGRRGGRKRRLFNVTPSGVESAERSFGAMHRLATEAGVSKVA